MLFAFSIDPLLISLLQGRRKDTAIPWTDSRNLADGFLLVKVIRLSKLESSIAEYRLNHLLPSRLHGYRCDLWGPWAD